MQLINWKKAWEKEWETNYPGPEQSVINHQRAFLAGYKAAMEEKEERFMSVTVDSCIPTDQIRFIFNGKEVGRIKNLKALQ